MNNLTKLGLNILNKAKLDYFAVKVLNNKIINPLMLKYCWQRRNYLSYYKQYQEWKEKLEKNGVELRDKKILEIGSGGSIGLGYFFLQHGVKLWVGTDFFQDLNNQKKLIANESELIKEIHENFYQDIFEQVDCKNGKINFSSRLNFFRLPAEKREVNFFNNFDAIISTAALEHLSKQTMVKVVENMASYLRSGGLMIHEIDLVDHINVANPFGFYRYSEREWENLTKGTIFYTNRLRLPDYLKIFSQNNLKMRYQETLIKPLPPKIKIDPCFLAYRKSDLEITRVFLILEKLG